MVFEGVFFVFLRMRCVIFFDTLPKGFGDSFVAPHLLPGTNCIMNPERMPVSAPSNECPRWWKLMTLNGGGETSGKQLGP